MDLSKIIFQQASEIIAQSIDLGHKIIIAESCTGGLISAALTEVSGSSRVVEGGFFAYSHEMKQNILGVSAENSMKFGAVSQEIAAEMAIGALKNSNANIALSVTGVAGPTGGTPEKPVGLVYICAMTKSGKKLEEKHWFEGHDRAGVRANTVRESLIILMKIIQ